MMRILDKIFRRYSHARAIAVKKKCCLELLTHRNVVGVGVGIKTVRNVEIGKPCIKIYVGKKLPISLLNSSEVLPDKIDGVHTDVVEFGLQSNKPRLQPAPGLGKRLRPVPIGASIGHFALKGAGTVTGYFESKKTGQIYLASCWHVLTNYGQGQKGDEIIQPASIDGGTKEKDIVGCLEDWIDVKMLGPVLGEAKSNLKAILNRGQALPINKVDVAFARPITKNIIPKMPAPRRTGDPKLGNKVIWIGRTSGISTSQIIDTNATIWVNYTGHGVALFDDVSLSKGGNLPGDSGAPFFISM